TMDEAFELLTLLQTGKAYPSPVVLLDTPGSRYWERWREFVVDELLHDGMIKEDDLHLVHLTDDLDDAVEHICRFFTNYHSMRYVGRRLVVRHHHPVSDEQLALLNDEFADIVERGAIERVEASPS